MFKEKNMMLPVAIGNYFDIDRCAEQHSHFTRNHTSTLNGAPRIKCRSKTGEKSVQFVGSKLWFDLPLELRSCESLNSFKYQYKNYLLNSDS